MKKILKKVIICLMALTLVTGTLAQPAEIVDAARKTTTKTRHNTPRNKAQGHQKKANHSKPARQQKKKVRQPSKKRIVPRRPKKARGKVAKRSPKKAPKKARGKVAKRSPKKAPKKARGKAAKRSPKKASKKARGKAAKRSPKKATKKARGKTAKRSPKKATKKARGKAAKRSVKKSPSTLAKIGYFAGDIIGINDAYTLVTGKDIASGKKASRLVAAAWLAAGLIPFGKVAKVVKGVAKGAKEAVKLTKISRVGKILEKSDKVTRLAKPAKRSLSKNAVKTFKPGELEKHFAKHGDEVGSALGKGYYTEKQYLNDAHNVVKSGEYIPELNGYLKYIGRPKGDKTIKYGFVGLDRKTEKITTFHIKSLPDLQKKLPNKFPK